MAATTRASRWSRRSEENLTRYLRHAADLGPLFQALSAACSRNTRDYGCSVRVLVDRDDDCLDMVIAPSLASADAPSFGQRLHEFRRVVVVAEILHLHQRRRPSTLPCIALGRVAMRRLRSPIRPSRRASCRDSTSSPSAVERPAR